MLTGLKKKTLEVTFGNKFFLEEIYHIMHDTWLCEKGTVLLKKRFTMCNMCTYKIL